MVKSSALSGALAITLSLLVLCQPAFAAGINPFPKDIENLTKGEIAGIKSAIRQALDTYQNGNIVKWISTDSKRTGEVTILQVYQQGGRRCASVQNKFTDGVGNTYQLPFCQIADGSWKVSF